MRSYPPTLVLNDIYGILRHAEKNGDGQNQNKTTILDFLSLKELATTFLMMAVLIKKA